MKLRMLPVGVSVVAVGVLTLAGCGATVSNPGSGASASATCSPGSGGSAAAPGSLSLSIPVDQAVAAKVPAAVKAKGTLTVATDASYAPNEFTDASGKIVGMDVDLGTAIGQVLGVQVHFVNASFDGILAGIAAGRYDLSLSSFTDTKEREKTVDFVNYFTAGTSIMAKACNPLGIRTQVDLCGKNVGAENGTVQLDTLTKDDAGSLVAQCRAAGKPAPVGKGYPKQTDVNAALAAGRIDAYLADSPVVAYAVKTSGGQFQTVGTTSDVAPYGIAVPKNGGTLKDAISGALGMLIQNGDYTKILNNWGVGSGAVTAPQINGAQS